STGSSALERKRAGERPKGFVASETRADPQEPHAPTVDDDPLVVVVLHAVPIDADDDEVVEDRATDLAFARTGDLGPPELVNLQAHQRAEEPAGGDRARAGKLEPHRVED